MDGDFVVICSELRLGEPTKQEWAGLDKLKATEL
jgi:hypothetical protein